MFIHSFIHSFSKHPSSAYLCLLPVLGVDGNGGSLHGSLEDCFVHFHCPFMLFPSPVCPASSQLPNTVGSLSAVSSILSTLSGEGEAQLFLNSCSSSPSVPTPSQGLRAQHCSQRSTSEFMAPCNCPDKAWPPVRHGVVQAFFSYLPHLYR